jgi:hypothetical protein
MTLPSCIRTQPNPIFDASQNTSKGFSMSGCARTGAVVNSSVRCGKLSYTPLSTQTCDLSVADLSLAWQSLRNLV